MKYSIICIALFLTCELVGAWQDWIHLMIAGGGWLVLGLLLLVAPTNTRE